MTARKGGQTQRLLEEKARRLMDEAIAAAPRADARARRLLVEAVAAAERAAPRLAGADEQELARLVKKYGKPLVRNAIDKVQLRRPGPDPKLLEDMWFAETIERFVREQGGLTKAFYEMFCAEVLPEEHKKAGAFDRYCETAKKRRRRGNDALKRFRAAEPLFYDHEWVRKRWAEKAEE